MTLPFLHPVFREMSLRPVEARDRDRLLVWRNRPEVRAGMFTTHEIAPAEHAAWFARLIAKPKPFYFIAEHLGRPVGVAGFTDCDEQNRRAEWSFHIGEYDAPRGAGSAMGALAIDAFFADGAFDKLCCSVLDGNDASLRMHRKLGFEEEGFRRRHVWRDGVACDVHEFALFADKWRAMRAG